MHIHICQFPYIVIEIFVECVSFRFLKYQAYINTLCTLKHTA